MTRHRPYIWVRALWSVNGTRKRLLGWKLSIIGWAGTLHDTRIMSLERAQRIGRAWAKHLGLPDSCIRVSRGVGERGSSGKGALPSGGDELGDRILAILRDSGGRLKRSDIHAALSFHMPASVLGRRLEELRARRLVRRVVEPTSGRQREVWVLHEKQEKP